MSPSIIVHCPGCAHAIELAGAQGSAAVACPSCGAERPLATTDVYDADGSVERCAGCGGELFYVQKDFSRMIGCLVFASTILLSAAVAWIWGWIWWMLVLVAAMLLDALLYAGRPGADRPSVDTFYVKLSTIVRSYLENRFALRSPELTTEEFLGEMGRSPDLARSHQRLLREFLQHADLVKFAAHLPSGDDIGAQIRAAENFLEETRNQAFTPEQVRG